MTPLSCSRDTRSTLRVFRVHGGMERKDAVMKRYSCLVVLLLCLLLGGCGSVPDSPFITVSLVEAEGCYIPANGQRIRPGEDVSFELVLEEGYTFASVDYRGSYRFEIRDGKEYLCLFNVQYPTRAELVLTDRFRTVCYCDRIPGIKKESATI